MFPTKNQVLKNFLSCVDWEEKYLYIIDLGKSLPKFPENLRTKTYFITGCQNHTWIALIPKLKNNKIATITFYGDSNSSIIKGIIVIIFGLYQNLNITSMANLDITPFLNQLKLNQYLTISRIQGIYSILNSIHTQSDSFIKYS